SDELRERLQSALPDADIVLGSGMSECTPATVMQWPELNPDKSASWGYGTPATENRICDPGGPELLPADTDGELAYRGPTVMEGYWNNPDANAAAFVGGHLHSGDLGRIDADGVVWFTDRVKDIVKSGGENVSSLHVERVLLDHPHVAEVACVGRPDPTWGESVVAVVVAAEGAPADDELRDSVLEFGAARLTAAQRPRGVVLVGAIPRTATGKLRQEDLRGALGVAPPAGGVSAPARSGALLEQFARDLQAGGGEVGTEPGLELRPALRPGHQVDRPEVGQQVAAQLHPDQAGHEFGQPFRGEFGREPRERRVIPGPHGEVDAPAEDRSE